MQKGRRIYFIAIAAVLISLLILSTLVYNRQKSLNRSQLRYTSNPVSPNINTEVNQKFIDTVLSEQTEDINNGLSIERLNVVALEGVPTPSANHISLLVLNRTEESIEFENIGFDIQVFEYDTSTFQWNRVDLPFTPDHKKKIIPPRLEDFDFNVLNYWELTEGDFINTKTSNVRILISGIGLDTDKKYYAFMDLTLQK